MVSLVSHWALVLFHTGVMNAADTYGVEDLRAACFEFALRFITLKTVLRLLVSADMYSDYKGTKAVVAKVSYLTSYLHALLDWSS